MLEAQIPFLQQKLLGISTQQYLMALGFIFSGFLLRRLAEWALARLAAAAKKTPFAYDDILLDALAKPLPIAFILVGFFLAAHSMPIPKTPIDLGRFLDALLRAGSIALGIWAALRLVEGATRSWSAYARKTDSRIDDQLVPIVRQAGKVFLYLIGGVLVLQNLGYSVGSLLAGFGLGGAAIALAAKDSLSNLFGSLVVFMDRPFNVGDWIEVGSVEGTVEEVGLRTTRIRTFANSQITMPNMLFTTTSINNWSRMRKRRIKMTVGLTYGTPPAKVERIVKGIRELIRDSKDIRSDFYLVNFDGFGSSSLDLFIYCFTHTTQWAEFLDVKERFMLDIMRLVHEEGSDFAFPTRTIHHVGRPPVEPALN